MKEKLEIPLNQIRDARSFNDADFQLFLDEVRKLERERVAMFIFDMWEALEPMKDPQSSVAYVLLKMAEIKVRRGTYHA